MHKHHDQQPTESDGIAEYLVDCELRAEPEEGIEGKPTQAEDYYGLNFYPL